MRIILITQDDPFYLAEQIKYLIEILPDRAEIVGCVLFDVAPFGKAKSKVEQARETYEIFGLKFFLHYSLKYIRNKIRSDSKVSKILVINDIPLIKLSKRINHKDSLELISSYRPDLLVSIAGNQIFKRPLLDLAPKGCLNLHTSLLPKYRGLMPTFWVLKNDEQKTGVSVFFVDEGIDSGPIVVQREIFIEDRTQEELIKDTKRLGMQAISEAIKKILNNDVYLIDNPESEMTYFSRPTRQDVDEFLAKGKKFF